MYLDGSEKIAAIIRVNDFTVIYRAQVYTGPEDQLTGYKCFGKESLHAAE